MKKIWIQLISIVVIPIITALLGFSSGYFSASYSYKAEVLRAETALRASLEKREHEIKIKKIDFFLERCKKIEAINIRLGESFQHVFINSLPVNDDEVSKFEQELTKLKISSIQAETYFGKEAEIVFHSELEKIEGSELDIMEGRFMAHIDSFLVELKFCNNGAIFSN
jgi:hypothetical protein